MDKVTGQRLSTILLLGCLAAAGTSQCKTETPTELVLRSADGKREVRLTADGLRFSEGGRTTVLSLGQLRIAAGATVAELRVEDGAAAFNLKDEGPDRLDQPFIRADLDTRRRVRNSTGHPVSSIVVKAGEQSYGSKTIIHASETGGYLSVDHGPARRAMLVPQPVPAEK